MLSIEKDGAAHRTLLLRTFLRQFPDNRVPKDYYEFLRNFKEPESSRLIRLYGKYPKEAQTAAHQAMHAELGVTEPATIRYEY